MVEVAVESTVTPWVLRSITLIVSPDGVVPEWKRVDDGATTTSASATAVLPDQILCKLESKRFQVLERARTRGLEQNVGVGYCHIRERKIYIYKIFYSLIYSGRVPTQLVPTINSTHELIGDDACCAWDF